MALITNERYREFLDRGSIRLITQEELVTLLKRIDEREKRNKEQKKYFLILLYYTGARPSEILELGTEDFKKIKAGRVVHIQIQGKKRGLSRPVHLPVKLPYVRELWDFKQRLIPGMFLFRKLWSKSKTYYMTKAGDRREYDKKTDIVNHLVSRLCEDMPPGDRVNAYLFRHSRFSQLAEDGASMEQIMLLKGAKSISSVTPYMHMSGKMADKIGRLIK